jgi:hypothetical protein
MQWGAIDVDRIIDLGASRQKRLNLRLISGHDGVLSFPALANCKGSI